MAGLGTATLARPGAARCAARDAGMDAPGAIGVRPVQQPDRPGSTGCGGTGGGPGRTQSG